MCQKRTDSQKPLSGAWAKVQGHATAQLQLSNQSPTMCQLGLSVMKDSLRHNPGMTERTSVVQEQLQQLQRWRDGCTCTRTSASSLKLSSSSERSGGSTAPIR